MLGVFSSLFPSGDVITGTPGRPPGRPHHLMGEHRFRLEIRLHTGTDLLGTPQRSYSAPRSDGEAWRGRKRRGAGRANDAVRVSEHQHRRLIQLVIMESGALTKRVLRDPADAREAVETLVLLSECDDPAVSLRAIRVLRRLLKLSRAAPRGPTTRDSLALGVAGVGTKPGNELGGGL